MRPIRLRPAMATLAGVSCALVASTAMAQSRSDAARSGPYDRLLIRNAMVIPGHGGPAYGPADIIVERGKIARIISYNGVTGRPASAPAQGNRVIDATGMYVMPAVDLPWQPVPSGCGGGGGFGGGGGILGQLGQVKGQLQASTSKPTDIQVRLAREAQADLVAAVASINRIVGTTLPAVYQALGLPQMAPRLAPLPAVTVTIP